MLKIVQAPNPVLSQKAKAVTKIDKSVRELLKSMEKTLVSSRDPEGVGLAAPQVGKSVQIFIVKLTPTSPTHMFINPIIESLFDVPLKKPVARQSKKTSKAKEKAGIEKGTQLEGCLSLYNVWGVVKRHQALILSYTDENGEKHKRKFDGFMAIVIQHEMDHLQGVLFPKRVLEQGNPLYKSVRNKKGEMEFEEIEI